MGPTNPPVGSKIRALSLEVRQPRYESSHLLPHSVHVKNTSSHMFISHYIVIVWSFIKLRGNVCFDPLFLIFFSFSSVISNQSTWVLYELMCWLSLVVRSSPARSLSWILSTFD